jgi:DNA helicase HerA-like ATPase
MSNILIGRNDHGSVELDPRYGNRHGMIAGATGTGKSVTLMLLAEGFSKLGVPCFLADAKGDLAGLSQAAAPAGDKLKARLAKAGITDWQPGASPVVFWDLYGKLGQPVRATISEMGPTLLGRVLELNDTQEGVLEIVFKVADEQGLLLLDLADLRSLLTFAAENAKDISTRYGLISAQSVAAIQRSLLKLEQDGADHFFGEPALELADLMRQDMSGRGVINILAAEQLIMKPRLYSTFLLWLLSELFEQLPEVGDLDQPKLVFFFDEAHLLFDDAPPALQQRVEQVVRLIRSKGVGVYFCSQNPDDVPGNILGQLGNRVQHALRAFTPRDQKAVKAAAETFVANPDLDVVKAIGQLGVGEALASTLGEGGVPAPVQQILVASPGCRLGAITEAERTAVRSRSPVGGKYDTAVNRDSAAEMLARRAQEKSADTAPPANGKSPAQPAGTDWGGAVRDALLGTGRRQGMIETMAKSVTRTVGSKVGQQIVRGILGSIFGGKR